MVRYKLDISTLGQQGALRQRILIKQLLRFYFSPANRHESAYMQRLIHRSSQGWVPIFRLAKFKLLKESFQNLGMKTNRAQRDMVASALHDCNELEVDQRRTKVRSRHHLPILPPYQPRTAYIHDPQSTLTQKQIYDSIKHIAEPEYLQNTEKGFKLVFSNKKEIQAINRESIIVNQQPIILVDQQYYENKNKKTLKQIEMDIGVQNIWQEKTPRPIGKYNRSKEEMEQEHDNMQMSEESNKDNDTIFLRLTHPYILNGKKIAMEWKKKLPIKYFKVNNKHSNILFRVEGTKAAEWVKEQCPEEEEYKIEEVVEPEYSQLVGYMEQCLEAYKEKKNM